MPVLKGVPAGQQRARAESRAASDRQGQYERKGADGHVPAGKNAGGKGNAVISMRVRAMQMETAGHGAPDKTLTPLPPPPGQRRVLLVRLAPGASGELEGRPPKGTPTLGGGIPVVRRARPRGRAAQGV